MSLLVSDFECLCFGLFFQFCPQLSLRLGNGLFFGLCFSLSLEFGLLSDFLFLNLLQLLNFLLLFQSFLMCNTNGVGLLLELSWFGWSQRNLWLDWLKLWPSCSQWNLLLHRLESCLVASGFNHLCVDHWFSLLPCHVDLRWQYLFILVIDIFLHFTV